MRNYFRRFVSYFLVVSLAGLPFTAQAGLIGTDEVAAQNGEQSALGSAAARETVRDFMSRADVQQQLQQHGLTPQIAKDRIDALTDAEVQQIAGKIDTLPAGASAGGAATIALVFLLVAVTYMLVRLAYPPK
jgi:hypothetical protein